MQRQVEHTDGVNVVGEKDDFNPSAQPPFKIAETGRAAIPKNCWVKNPWSLQLSHFIRDDFVAFVLAAATIYFINKLVLLATLLGCSEDHVLGYSCTWTWLVISCLYILCLLTSKTVLLLIFTYSYTVFGFRLNSGHGSFVVVALAAAAIYFNTRSFWPLYWAAQGTMFWAIFVLGHDW